MAIEGGSLHLAHAPCEVTQPPPRFHAVSRRGRAGPLVKETVVRARARGEGRQKMASSCKSQQCCSERRGFRQELDSWRHKLIHCVGFESILEGLFGPGLLKDLSLFKDYEPEGVSDWSFDENCLFCCLRREKVKEHLVGLNEPVSEAGQKAALRQEQAKIIRLERQAEEFLNAVFYRKDRPRVCDPNIPLVAREIMQRMIRQFAAEYTSKTSTTQDPSQPNSTKNQSQLKASPVQTSPTAATTRNPVLSKLLMADQESPLDLTVKKSQLESKEQDGVLDLSTKKSPSVGCSSSSNSPSSSSTLGNGDETSPIKEVHKKSQTTATLERFMGKLCTPHQKQFVHVLNNLCTEEHKLPESEQMTTSTCCTCGLQCTDIHEEGAVFSEEMANSSSEFHLNWSDSHGSTFFCSDHLKVPNIKPSITDTCLDGEKCISAIKEESSDVSISTFDTPKAVATQECIALSNSSLNVQLVSESLEGKAAVDEPHSDIKKCVEDEDQIQEKKSVKCFSDLKIAHVNSDDGSDSCPTSQKKSLKTLSDDTWDSELIINLPKNADKENSLQFNSKASLHQDVEINEYSASPKQENLRTLGRSKVSNRLHHSYEDQFDNSKDSWPSLRKTSNRHTRVKVTQATIKAVRNCKRASGVRINDFDNQCDVVYISQPITECQFENQRSILSSRKTARKSTRGYFFNGECCELSTVRTLVRSSKTEEMVNCSKIIQEALVFPKQALSNTVPLKQFAALANQEKSDVEGTPVNLLPSNPCNNDKSDISSIADEPKLQFEPCEPGPLHSREAESGPLMALLSLVHEEKTKDESSVEVQCTTINLPSSVKDEEDTKLVKSITSVGEEMHICTELLNEKVPEVSNTEPSINICKGKECLDSSTIFSKEDSNYEIISDAGPVSPIVVTNVEYPVCSTLGFPSEAACGKELVDHGLASPPVNSYEENHRNSRADSFLQNTHFLKSTDLRPVDTLVVSNGEDCVDLIPACSSRISHSEDLVDSRLALSFEGTHVEDLVDSRSQFSSDCSDGEDTVDFRLALSVENTPVKDSVESREDCPLEDAHNEEPVDTRLTLSSEDTHGAVADSRIVSPLEQCTASRSASPSHTNGRVSDSRHSSPLNVTNEKDTLDFITTSSTESYKNVGTGYISTSNASRKETLDPTRPTSPFLVSNSKETAVLRCVSLSEDFVGEVIESIPASPAEISNREEAKYSNPASPSEIITREEAINIRPVSPLSIAKIDECVGSVFSSQLETAIRKDKNSPNHRIMLKRSAVNTGSTGTEKVTFGQGNQCDASLNNPNLKKNKKVGTTNAKSMQDNRKKSEPFEKYDANKKMLRKKKKKRPGKVEVKSDRRLRSQHLHSSADNSSEEFASSSSLQVPGLKIKLSKGHGAKRFQRMVCIHRAKSVHFPIDCFHRTLLENMRNANLDESENSSDEHPVITRQAYKNMLAKNIVEGSTGLYGSESTLTLNHDDPFEALEISVDVNSSERTVNLLMTSPTNCTEQEEKKVSPIHTKDLENIKSKTLIGKYQNDDSSTSSQTFPITRSGMKAIPSRTLMKHKKFILRNQNVRPASTLEKCNKKKSLLEDRIVSAKEEKPADCMMEEDASGDKPIDLNEGPQGNDSGKFINWFAEEENQELIADFNAKYMKVQKGWILLEKESQPVHKVKNKSDKLKEIWKTKKRARKSRNSLEVQKLSPVQVLFMKAFKLSDICKWFLETTETKSLVIVKKVTTRLPGDFPMPMIPIQRYPSSIVYPPSAQAERLKKHLKKFAAASPVKINPKNQKLWAKFRDTSDDDSGNSNSSSLNTILEVVSDQRNVKSSQSLKTPASARILRKYSNMRGKLRAQYCLLKNDRKDVKKQEQDENKSSRKIVCINPLMSPKLALQVKADSSCDQAEVAFKGKKGKKWSQEGPLLKSDIQTDKKKRTQDNPSSTNEAPSSSPKVRQTIKKVSSKVIHTRVLSTRKQATLDCISKVSKKPSLKEKKAKGASKKPVQKEVPIMIKGKDNKTKSKAKLANRPSSSMSPKVKGTRESPCKLQKKYVKTQTRSVKKNVKNAALQKRKYEKAKPDAVVLTKRRRLDMKL